jgi:cytochrome c5
MPDTSPRRNAVRPLRKRARWLIWAVLLVIVGHQLWSHRFGVPEDFTDAGAHFKYGSIGADHPLARAPLPYWIWKVLPEVFPPSEVMPRSLAPRNTLKSFAAFGLVSEAAMDRPVGMPEGQVALERPIGFSTRNVFGLEFVGMNCAFCHTTTLRRAPDQKPDIILGGTGNSVDIERYFLFMFAAFESPRFNGDVVMDAVLKEAHHQHQDLNLAERLLYRYVFIPAIPKVLAKLKVEDFDFIALHSPTRLPNFGPGRVDTWSLYKRQFVDPPQRDPIPGIVDFPAIWNQKARVGMRMHWDGNTDVLEERNIVSALALIGSRLDYLDYPRLTRVSDWSVGLLPPRYQDRIPDQFLPDGKQAIRSDLAARGETLFRSQCANCHAADGIRVGRVEPNDDLATDGHRVKDFTPELAGALNELGTEVWKLRNFKPQSGYVNNLLDGIWLRSPYLHNGSVPTLRDLLNEPEKRPRTFCRGDDLYDWKNVGFVSTPQAGQGAAACGKFFLYDTSVPGNGNLGHRYGTSLGDNDKEALLEFLKTL